MAKAKQQPNGKWRLRSYIGTDSTGKKIFQSFTCDTEAQCYKEEKKWLKAGGGVIVEEKPKGPTVDEVIEQYIDGCRNSKRKTYSPSTIRGYECVRKNDFPVITDVEAGSLTTDDIQDWVDSLASRGLAVKTIKNAIGILKPSLEKSGLYAVHWREIELPESEPEDYIIPTDEEVQMLLDATKDTNPKLYQAIVLGAFCGCRRSEICALTHGDVDQQNLQIHITKAKVLGEDNTYATKETKTRAGKRDIDIDQTILNAVLINDIPGVIYTPNVPLIDITPAALSSGFRYLRKKLGFEFCFHSLRHYHASIMVALNVPRKYAAEQMGHSTYDMIDKVYGQIVREKEKAISSAINGHASTVLNGGTYDWAEVN